MYRIKLRLCLLLPNVLVFMTNATNCPVPPEENQAVEVPLGLMRFFFLSFHLSEVSYCNVIL